LAPLIVPEVLSLLAPKASSNGDDFYRTMIINPATSLFVISRSWLIGGEPPMYLAFFIVTACSILLLLAAVVILKVSLPHIIERISG
jgi:ABC-type polysaccharide/polyol phosphate export permease